MNKLTAISLPIFGALLLSLGACSVKNIPATSSLDEKMEPYDQFAWQRAYPDRAFDWKGWRKNIRQARVEATAVERSSSSDCGGSSPVAWTLQGPGNVAGRINALAAHPENEDLVLAGFSGGGIFKTIDGGVNWVPVFDDNPELSIGDITFDPSSPNVVYASTGDPNIPAIVFNGNGIYKSTDAGDTWSYLALDYLGIISKVVVDPTNSNILYAAAMGNPYIRDNQRGIYKSTDGGQNWTQVLFISDQAGASDLVINESNPQVLYASFWDRVRSNQESVIFGPNAKVYKTTNGGQNWNELGGGLPTGTMGRTGLAISKMNPDKVYAIYVDSTSRPGGLYKTTDGGNNWQPMNINGLQDAYANFGWYFGKVRINDFDDEDVYVLGILLWRKTGASWQIAAGAHADCHDLLFVPSGKRYLATDGGMYTNIPGNIIWNKSLNLPTTQFYHTDYNLHEPDLYYGGSQDNGIRSGNGSGFNNWASIFSADGFNMAFDPTNPDRFWVEIQNGAIHRTEDGGGSWVFGQSCLGTTDRCNWDTPFFMSIHPQHWLYAGTYRAYASTGSSWGVISGDLTDGNIYGAGFHTISCMDESPLEEGRLFAGTSDGNVWWRSVAGDWTEITTGLPDRYVTSVKGSPTDVNTIFTSHSGFRDNEIIPHVHRSYDNGQNWTDISSNLPQVPVNDLLVLPGHADSILFAATDAGVYFTKSGGADWLRLGNNMPFLPVFDLERNPIRNELVAATFAQGMWSFPLDSLLIEPGGNVTVQVSGAVDPLVDDLWVDYNGMSGYFSGSFNLENIPGCDSVVITPSSDVGHLNGVTTFDLVKIAQHILNIESLNSPYKIIAADANRSNSVTTFDIVEFRKLILGIYNELPQNDSWRFIPKSFTFTQPDDPFGEGFPESLKVHTQDVNVNGADFWSIKIGDVSSMWGPLFSPDPDDRNAQEPLVFELEPKKTGSRIEVLISSTSSQLAGVQFTLGFDPGSYRFEELIPISPEVKKEHFNPALASEGKLPVCIDLPNGTSDRQLFKLVFTIREGLAFDKRHFKIQDSPTPAIAFDNDGNAFIPVWSTDSGNTVALAYPNPFGAEGVRLKTKGFEGGNLVIFSTRGKEVFRQAIGSENEVFLPSTLFSAKGSYIYLIEKGKERVQGSLEYLGK